MNRLASDCIAEMMSVCLCDGGYLSVCWLMFWWVCPHMLGDVLVGVSSYVRGCFGGHDQM